MEKKAQVLKMYLGFHEKRKKDYIAQAEQDKALHAQELAEKQAQLRKIKRDLAKEQQKV